MSTFRRVLLAVCCLLVALLLVPAASSAAGPVRTIGTCVLQWDAPTTNADATPLTDLAKYRLYVGTAPGVKKSATATAEILAPNPAPAAGTTASWTCVGLTGGQKYAVVTAVDQAGNESGESNEVPFVVDLIVPGAPASLRLP